MFSHAYCMDSIRLILREQRLGSCAPPQNVEFVELSVRRDEVRMLPRVTYNRTFRYYQLFPFYSWVFFLLKERRKRRISSRKLLVSDKASKRTSKQIYNYALLKPHVRSPRRSVRNQDNDYISILLKFLCQNVPSRGTKIRHTSSSPKQLSMLTMFSGTSQVNVRYHFQVCLQYQGEAKIA